MDDVRRSTFGRAIVILLSILLGVILAWFVIKPLLGLFFLVIWKFSGVVAFVFRALLFIAISFAAIMGLLILLSWLIREFLD